MTIYLEVHGVRLVTLGQRESSLQIRVKEFYFSNVGRELGIDSGLGSLSLRGGHGGLGGVVEQSLLSLLGDLLLAGEESIVNLGHINAIDRHLGGGADHVALVHSAKRDTVAGIRTWK